MNAGTLTVAVQGDFSAFLAQMSKLQQAAEAEAKRVGDVVSKSMTSRIGDGLGKVKDDIVKTAEQIPRAAERALPKVVKEVEKTAKTSRTQGREDDRSVALRLRRGSPGRRRVLRAWMGTRRFACDRAPQRTERQCGGDEGRGGGGYGGGSRGGGPHRRDE